MRGKKMQKENNNYEKVMNLLDEICCKLKKLGISIEEKLKECADNMFARTHRNISINFNPFFWMALIGIMLRIIATNFYPEFPNDFPYIYFWFNWGLELFETLLQFSLGLIGSIFKLNLFGYFQLHWNEIVEVFKKLFNVMISLAS